MKTLSYFNSKGGVGKTTIAAETAIYFLMKGYRVICIDTDINGSLLDFAFDRSEKCELAFPETIGHVQSNIDRKIKSLRESGKYDLCIVDCHGDWDRLDENLLYETDIAIMPVIPDIKNIRPTIKVFLDQIVPIMDERQSDIPLETFLLINNIRKNHGQTERALIKEIIEADVPLLPTYIHKHEACFRDVWREGLTIMDIYLNDLDSKYINAGINIRKYMEQLKTKIDLR